MAVQEKKRDEVLTPFTLEDVREVIGGRAQPRADTVTDSTAAQRVGEVRRVGRSKPKKGDGGGQAKVASKRTAVSVLDILGFDPKSDKGLTDLRQDSVPQKWKKYFQILLPMREELHMRLSQMREEALPSGVVHAGERSGPMGQNSADGAAEHADLERAMSFVENEEELLREVEAALERIHRGTYGICEQTGEPIDAKRLEVLPFARFSLRGREEYERMRRNAAMNISRDGPLFAYGDGTSEPLPSNEDDGEE